MDQDYERRLLRQIDFHNDISLHKTGDRFIPARAGANWSINFHTINYALNCKKAPADDGNEISPYSLSPLSNKRAELLSSDLLSPVADSVAYAVLLKNELLGAGIEKYALNCKKAPADDGNEISPYSLSPLSNKR
ncbi:UNVERIFIED_CONTAM: hypothetical protein FKN15_073033 [Acipenser sinensis]